MAPCGLVDLKLQLVFGRGWCMCRCDHSWPSELLPRDATHKGWRVEAWSDGGEYFIRVWPVGLKAENRRDAQDVYRMVEVSITK